MKAYQNIALAYIIEESASEIIDEEDAIHLPPMLAHNFQGNQTVLIRPWRRSESLLELDPGLTDVIGWKPGMLQMVTSINMQLVSVSSSKIQTFKVKAVQPKLQGSVLLDHFKK